MQVRVGNILYIYEFINVKRSPKVAAGVFGMTDDLRKREQQAMEGLRRIMGIKPRDAAEAAKLEKLEQIIAAMMGKIHKVPGEKMKGIILDAIQKIVAKAVEGDLDGALLLADQTEEMCNKAVKAGERIGNAMGRLSMMALRLPEAGKKAVGDLLKKAEKMINAASEPSELEAIASSLEFAVDIVNSMLGHEAGSPGFQGCMRLLEGVMNDIESAVKGGPAGNGAPMAQDALTLSFKNAADALNEIKGKTKDTVKQQQIGKLEERLAELQDRAQQLPEAMKPMVQSGINQMLADAANGDITKAAERLNELFSQVDQCAKLNQVVHTKLKLGRQVADRLQGPAKEALEAFLKKADAAREACKTPQELQDLEALVLEAIKEAQKPCAGKAAQNAQLRKLKGFEKRCEAIDPPPSFGDELKLGQADKRARTERLGPGKTGALRPEDLHQAPADGKRDVWQGQVAIAIGVEVPAFGEAELAVVAALIEPQGQAKEAQKPEAQEKRRGRLSGRQQEKQPPAGTNRLPGTGRLSEAAAARAAQQAGKPGADDPAQRLGTARLDAQAMRPATARRAAMKGQES